MCKGLVDAHCRFCTAIAIAIAIAIKILII